MKSGVFHPVHPSAESRRNSFMLSRQFDPSSQRRSTVLLRSLSKLVALQAFRPGVITPPKPPQPTVSQNRLAVRLAVTQTFLHHPLTEVSSTFLSFLLPRSFPGCYPL